MVTIKSLAFHLWLAMAQWVSPQEQTAAWREPAPAAAGRYFDFAESLARVCLDPDELPVPGLAEDDETARARTAILLASIASYESRFADAVVRCVVLGPGEARGPWQCEGRRCAEVCKDVTHAARVALTMVRQSVEVCAELELPDRIGFYTDGKCRPRWQRSRTRVARATRWWHAHPLESTERMRGEWLDL